jgi:hypothetical protein
MAFAESLYNAALDCLLKATRVECTISEIALLLVENLLCKLAIQIERVRG